MVRSESDDGTHGAQELADLVLRCDAMSMLMSPTARLFAALRGLSERAGRIANRVHAHGDREGEQDDDDDDHGSRERKVPRARRRVILLGDLELEVGELVDDSRDGSMCWLEASFRTL